MIQKILATAALALLPLSATLAQSTTAQNLPRADVSTEAMVALCQSRTDLEAQTFCYGFGEGVYQTYELNLDPKVPKTVCLPAAGVARDVVLAEFIQWALANPTCPSSFRARVRPAQTRFGAFVTIAPV